MDIRFVSTLTADDENEFAPALLRALSALLDTTPIAYTLRIETLDGAVFQHAHPASAPALAPVETRGAIAVALHARANA